MQPGGGPARQPYSFLGPKPPQIVLKFQHIPQTLEKEQKICERTAMFFIPNVTRKCSSERSLYLIIRAGIFGRDVGEKSSPGIEQEPSMESSRTYPRKFNFQSRNRLFIPCRQLLYCLRVGNVLTNRSAFSHTQHMTMIILKSSIPSHGIAASKNKFHNRIDSSQESIPGVLKSLKIRAQDSGGPQNNTGKNFFGMDRLKSLHIMYV